MRTRLAQIGNLGATAGRLSLCWLALLLLPSAWAARAEAEEAQWIWSPAFEKELAPAGVCYFRKSFELGKPENGEIQISCDDSYELFVNGQAIGNGHNWKTLDVYDITKELVDGENVIAVKATNTEQGSAGLVARVVVKQHGGTHVARSSDGSWKTSLKEFNGWQKAKFNDVQWLSARTFGALNATLPWGNEVTVAGAEGRFKVLPNFHVEWVIEPQQTGSLSAMAFDEFGQIIAARENGSLLLIRDEDRDGLPDTVSTMCDQLRGCQGVLSVSGKVFAVGQGPQGAALYRLTDSDRDGKTDQVDAVLKFTGEMGEHGPHAPVLGPDGLIYILCGNFSHPEKKVEATSPYHDAYEGDLVQPRYEDSAGHAVGVKVPGGTVVRTDTSGSAVEVFAGGLQNPYDIAFNQDGELFTCDSDMEWDIGMPWYRPTRVNHLLPGGEFGWRSGWAKWPDYYFDSLPTTLDTGRGSPTGLEVYNHHMYPQRFHNALFVCDWSRGRILAVRMKQHGASYKATSEVFLEGQPLNVTDCAVGPDGWLYFCTGGRDTEGGIFRVVWGGNIPTEVKNLGKGLRAAILQPQLQSAWARQRVATLKQKFGNQWERELVDLVEKAEAPVAERKRALDLLQLFGPAPDSQLLVTVSQDRDPMLRARAAYLMGLHADDTTATRLGEMLSDANPLVERMVCESLARAGQAGPIDKLLPLLASPDRHVAWAARLALVHVDRREWETAVLEAADPRAFFNGALSLLMLYPEPKITDAIVERSSQMMKEYLSDRDFLDLLRLLELAVSKGKLTGDNVPELRRQLAEEYPSQDVRMNRELVRLLVHLQDPKTAERLTRQLDSDIPTSEKLHAAFHAPFLKTGWTTDRKLEILKFYEEARALPGGHSYAGYVENVSRDFFAQLNEHERQVVLAGGAKWPSSALSVLAKLPAQPSNETLAEIMSLDRQLKRIDSEAAKRLRIGIAAVLGFSGTPASTRYLREIYEKEPDRRVPIAMALAQHPDGDNWPVLVNSLSIVEGTAAQEVLLKLATVDRVPDGSEPYRQVIVRGLLLGESGSRQAVALLEKWTGRSASSSDDSWRDALTAWQQWFAQTYPNAPEATLPKDVDGNHWTYQELLSYLTGTHSTAGNALRGATLFEKARCAQCHRFGSRGEIVGPDLSTISSRFQKKEILESILFPSQVISDQYATQTVVTKDGRSLSGMVAPAGDGSLVVLQSTGEKVTVAQEEIETTTRSKQSSMPVGLLNSLSLEEVADLFAYLAKSPQAELTRRPVRMAK